MHRSCGTFAILAHSLSFVKHFFENFFVFFGSACRSNQRFQNQLCYLTTLTGVCQALFFRSSMAFMNQCGSNPLGVSESQPCYLSTFRTACQELFSETFQVRHLSGSSCRSLAPTALTEYQIPAHLSTPFSKFFFLLTFFAVPDRFPGIPLAIIHNNKGKRQHFHAAVTTTVMSSLSF